jgi:membrane protein YdbS with pleckstrin-like domain
MDTDIADVTGGGQLLDGTERGLDHRIRTVWMAGWALGIAVGFGAAATVLAVGGRATAAVTVGFAALAALGLAGLWVGAVWRRWRWSAWQDALELRHGVVIRRQSLVPYHRIQQIDVERGPIERVVGISTLVLRTAAASTDAKLPGIPAAHAQELRHRLLERAGNDDAV